MSTEPKQRNVVVTRVFDAPVEQVWKAWTDPVHVMHLFGHIILSPIADQSGLCAEKMLRTNIIFNDLGILMMLALLRFFLHLLTNGQYGFHRDELATLDDARYLAWGYVAYPPLTPFIARLAIELFGPSLIGVRLFSALAQSVVMVLAGLMTRELGGSRLAQIVTALAVAIAPISLLQGALFQYVSFDYLWWVLIAYLTIRLLKSENPRWWLGIGAVIGVGMMTRYTMAFFVAGIVGGVLLTQTRHYLTNGWLWGGVTLSLLIFLPNLIWQIQHDFISQEFLSSIHARDVELGRTEGFLIEQSFVCASLVHYPFVGGRLILLLLQSGRCTLPYAGLDVPHPPAVVLCASGTFLLPGARLPDADCRRGCSIWEQWLAKLSSGCGSPWLGGDVGGAGGWGYFGRGVDAAYCPG